MPFSPRSPGGSIPAKVYLFNCPYEEKENAKKAGARWDASAGTWYVAGGQNLEPFNKWLPNDRKYLVCSYSEKDEAKKAGARWDSSCKQWYFDANDSKAESRFARWLPSLKSVSTDKTKKLTTTNKKPKLIKVEKTNVKKTSSVASTKAASKTGIAKPQKVKPKALTKSQLATIPRINDDMTIPQLQTECRMRDPSTKGLSNKNKSWLLEHLKIGTPWISYNAPLHEKANANKDAPPTKKVNTAKAKPIIVAAKPSAKKSPTKDLSQTIHADMTVAQLQMECRARNPSITGISNKNKSWLLEHLKIGTPRAPAIHADMTVAELQMECRARDPNIKGISNKNKTWLLDHLKVGTPRAPTIHSEMTVAQLQMECQFRNPDVKGISNKNKTWLLDHLKIGTAWISSSISADTSKNENSKKSQGLSLVKKEATDQKKPPATAKVSVKKKRPAIIHADMTIAQLQLECRTRDPDIFGLSNKSKSWLIDHLTLGTLWISSEAWTKSSSASTNPTDTNQILKDAKNCERKKKPMPVTKVTTSSPGHKRTITSYYSPSPSKADASTHKQGTMAKPLATSKKRAVVSAVKPSVVKSCMPIKLDPDAKHASETKVGPPKKKQKKVVTTNPKTNSAFQKTAVEPPSAATAVSRHTRITSKMTMAQLKTEARVRLMEPKNTPKLKSGLLDKLVEGSICVHESPEYKAYQDLLKRVADEDFDLRKTVAERNRVVEERREKLRAERYAKEERKQAEAERVQNEKRQAEKIRQKCLHVHCYPRVHSCPLARTCDLFINETPRMSIAKCDLCERNWRYNRYISPITPSANNVVYTCESCDLDICQSCFQEENKSQVEKEKLRRKREREWEEERRREREDEEKEEEEYRKRWDAEIRFPLKVRKLAGKHLDPVSSGLKYTVWCSDGYDNDGWHSYEGEPTKEFDSVWKTKEEANSRAEYLFYWKNPWGMEPTQMNNEEVEETGRAGLLGWTVRPDDSSRWTVGIVPSEAFQYLDNASNERHNNDDDGRENRDENMFTYGFW